MKKNNWRLEAWEAFLVKMWDQRPKGKDVVEYSTKDLEPFLNRYAGSGVGEIRLLHYGHEKLAPIIKRGIIKLPISRKRWALVKRPSILSFSEPTETHVFEDPSLTSGMRKIVESAMINKTAPGETSLLALAKHVGIINHFYDTKEELIWFTGGRQSASPASLKIGDLIIDLSKGLIEIDGGFENNKLCVIVEMKSSLKQMNFDPNQCMLPWLKWRNLITNKDVFSMVLLFGVVDGNLEYWAYDLRQDEKSPLSVVITRSRKYILKLANSK